MVMQNKSFISTKKSQYVINKHANKELVNIIDPYTKVMPYIYINILNLKNI